MISDKIKFKKFSISVLQTITYFDYYGFVRVGRFCSDVIAISGNRVIFFKKANDDDQSLESVYQFLIK